jgi:hypothetical protein
MTATVSMTGYDWVAQATLAVEPGQYYRFVALFPAGTTQDEAYSQLCGSSDPSQCTKWDITSISAPPASIVAALQSAIASFPGTSSPAVWWIIATWLPASTTLSQPDGPLYYEQLSVYATSEGQPVPAPNVNDPNAQLSSSDWWPALIGAAVVGGAYLLFKSYEDEGHIAPHGARANPVTPVQTITAQVNGRPTKFAISTDGPTWTATADIKADRKRRIEARGSSKAEALQSAIALASQAYASADVRAQ